MFKGLKKIKNLAIFSLALFIFNFFILLDHHHFDDHHHDVGRDDGYDSATDGEVLEATTAVTSMIETPMMVMMMAMLLMTAISDFLHSSAHCG